MSEHTVRAARSPLIDLASFNRLKLLQVRSMALDSQLRNFSSLRDRAVASGKDPDAAYRTIQVRRDAAVSELKNILPIPAIPARLAGSVRGPQSVGALQTPVGHRFPFPPLGPGLGFSGTAPVGNGYDGTEIVPEGLQYAALGSIYTVSLNNQGAVFDGDLKVKPDVGEQTSDDGGLDYYYLHNWLYIVDFPAAVVKSTFTYSFNVQAFAYIWRRYGNATLYTFASVGESANYSGQEIIVNADGGWPFIVDLSQPDFQNDSLYNGFYPGYIAGSANVQRSLVVEGGQQPAVAVVVGVISAQSSESAVLFELPGEGTGGSLVISSLQGQPGLVNYSYNPSPLVARQ
jgi:hypothetical protein